MYQSLLQRESIAGAVGTNAWTGKDMEEAAHYLPSRIARTGTGKQDAVVQHANDATRVEPHFKRMLPLQREAIHGQT
jgi:hypothetical protein